MRHVIRNVIDNLVLAMRHVSHHVMRDVIDHVTQSWGFREVEWVKKEVDMDQK